DLASKPEIVALNKCDSLTDEEIKKKVAAIKRATKKTPYVISAVAHQGTTDLMRAVIPFLK
ncbi:MAG: GTPase ObgE, partial [Alphaproteobacteria bacterium]|nr:GTPase ObgE [Alphaproteobacteria bacterium]